MRRIEVHLLIADLDDLILRHAGNTQRSERAVIEQRQRPTADVTSASVAGRLHLLDVLPVVLGNGRSPVADGREMRADLGIRLQPVGFISRQRQTRIRSDNVVPAIEYGSE